VLQIRILDLVPFDSWMRDPDPGWNKIQIQVPESGINITDLIFENLVSVFWFKNKRGFGSGILSSLDPGSGMGKIGSATLIFCYVVCVFKIIITFF